MMARYLVTQSLLGSWAYMFDCYEGGEEEAKASFLKTLNREHEEPNQAMRDGIAFENAVYALAGTGKREYPGKWKNGVESVATYLKGAQVQVRASREIRVAGMTFLVYGILDGLKAGTIFDVKYKAKSFKDLDLAGDYLNSPQHPTYFYLIPEAHEFIYLVSDGEDLYTERYIPQETRDIADFISDFVQSLQSMGLLDLYKEKWEADRPKSDTLKSLPQKPAVEDEADVDTAFKKIMDCEARRMSEEVFQGAFGS